MNSSFIDSAILELLSEADRLEPDYSGKPNQVDSDQFVCSAPDRFGKLLALRRRYCGKADNPAFDRKSCLAVVSLIENILSLEQRAFLKRYDRRSEMHLRNTANFVIAKHGSKAQADDARTAA